jgi:hypothetical protein
MHRKLARGHPRPLDDLAIGKRAHDDVVGCRVAVRDARRRDRDCVVAHARTDVAGREIQDAEVLELDPDLDDAGAEVDCLHQMSAGTPRW